MNQLIYHTEYSETVTAQLQEKQFESAGTYFAKGGDGTIFLVINKPQRKFWMTTQTGLAEQNNILEAVHDQNILPITLNEIQSWES